MLESARGLLLGPGLGKPVRMKEPVDDSGVKCVFVIMADNDRGIDPIHMRPEPGPNGKARRRTRQTDAHVAGNLGIWGRRPQVEETALHFPRFRDRFH